jgi:hypothetical protein
MRKVGSTLISGEERPLAEHTQQGAFLLLLYLTTK